MRFVLLLIAFIGPVLGLSGCAGQYGYAPVDYRGQKGSGSAQWQAPELAKEHRVERGDTLYSIAFQHSLSYQEVASWNGIGPPYLIRVGQILSLSPPGTTAADTRSRSGMSWDTDTTRTRKPTNQTKVAAAKPKPKAVSKPQKKPRPKKKTASKPKKKKPAASKRTGPVTWSWPTAGRVSKGFSRRASGKKGIGINGKAGQAIKAAASGRVVYSGSGLVGYGKLIIVKHNDVYLSAYGHNSKLLVREGQRVKKGQTIAEMGSTSTKRPMLHFEIRKHGKPVNPQRYLPKR